MSNLKEEILENNYHKIEKILTDFKNGDTYTNSIDKIQEIISSALDKQHMNNVMSNLKEEILKEVWERMPDDITDNDKFYSTQIEPHIKNALEKQHKADMEEVIKIAEDMAGKTNVELESDGIDDGIGYFVALKSLINTLKEKI